MRGTYRFYQDGVLIAESENLLTTAGKTAILRYLAGYSGHFGKSLRLGVGTTAANVADVNMNFESVQAPITLISPDYTNTTLVFKARLSDDVAGSFYEAGLSTAFNAQAPAFGSALMLAFDTVQEGWVGGASNVTGTRVGSSNLRLSAAASATTTATVDTLLDLSGYSNADEFKLAYNVTGTFVASTYLRFYTDASNYFTYTIATPTAGYKTTTFNKSNFVATGTPSWANITQVAVSATATAGGTATVDFDGFRIDDKDTYGEVDTIVSRTVLGTPVTKTAGIPLDVEYTLDLTL